MVATEHHGNDAARGNRVDPLADVGVRYLGLPVRAVRVTEIDHFEPVEDLETEIEVVGARFVGRGPDRPGTEPGARAVGRRDVERRTDDRHIGLPGVELGGLGQERPVPERDHARVRQVQLLGHAGRQLTLGSVIVLIAHEQTLPPPARRHGRVGRFIGRQRNSARYERLRERVAWTSHRSRRRRRHCSRTPGVARHRRRRCPAP